MEVAIEQDEKHVHQGAESFRLKTWSTHLRRRRRRTQCHLCRQRQEHFTQCIH